MRMRRRRTECLYSQRITATGLLQSQALCSFSSEAGSSCISCCVEPVNQIASAVTIGFFGLELYLVVIDYSPSSVLSSVKWWRSAAHIFSTARRDSGDSDLIAAFIGSDYILFFLGSTLIPRCKHCSARLLCSTILPCHCCSMDFGRIFAQISFISVEREHL